MKETSEVQTLDTLIPDCPTLTINIYSPVVCF